LTTFLADRRQQQRQQYGRIAAADGELLRQERPW
jgi:hypothetical protein